MEDTATKRVIFIHLVLLLYEMVTGRVPFDGDTTVAIAIKHLQEEMVPPSVYAERFAIQP